MSNERISYITQADGSADVIIPACLLPEFKHLVQRAISTWQAPSPEIRDFADAVLGIDKLKPTWKVMSGTTIIASSEEFQGTAFLDPTSHDSPDQGLARRSCCGTLLREPHHTQCKELLSRLP